MRLSELDAETKEWTSHDARSHTLCLPKFFHLYSPEEICFKKLFITVSKIKRYLFIYLFKLVD